MSTSLQQNEFTFQNCLPDSRTASDATKDFDALPPPGAALFPQYVSDCPLSITMKRKTFGDSWIVTYSISEKMFLNVDAEKMSMSRRKHLIDQNLGQELCELRRQSSARIKYFGVDAVNGSTLFQTETRVRWSGHETTMNFINNATSGYHDSLKVKQKPFSSYGEVTYQEKPVASIKLSDMRRQYDLQIAPGLDPFLIVALAAILYDKDK